MRIAVVHSFYSSKQPSGENQSVLAEIAALSRAGHEVQLFASRTDEAATNLLFPVRSAFRVASGYGHSPLAAIEKYAPDIVHIHNLFPNFSRRWVSELTVPVVHTLRNYRPLCANGLLFRDGRTCTRCPDGDRYAGLRFGCYRDSKLATLPLAVANSGGPNADPLLNRADVLLVLTELQREQYERAGIPSDRLVVHPNFFEDALTSEPGEASAGAFVTVGRLSPEKGIGRLAQVWPLGVDLDIVGDGPDRAMIESLGNPSIRVLGLLPHAETLRVIRRSRALVFPSLWFETFGRTALEAWGCATPVIATPGNTVAAMIAAHGGGTVATWDDLPALVSSLEVDEEARAEARAVFEANYTEAAFVSRAEAIYRRLIEQAGD